MLLDLYCIFSAILAIIYSFIIGRYIYGWNLLEEWQIPKNHEVATTISVLIPARNEAENILACIHAILAQDYPSDRFEIIVIDDHSTDQTATLVQNLKHSSVRLLSLADHINEPQNQYNSFKKLAISLGVAQARGTLIVTTDADCMAPPSWLYTLASFHETTQKEFIAAPVVFHRENNLLQRFQSLDFMGMMLITGAGIRLRWMYMCNGANLAYTKQLFQAVGGFEGLGKYASGDDMFLMHKVLQKYPDQIGYLKSAKAVVKTEAKADLRSFFRQRLRWATKSAAYQDWKVTLILALVFFFCCSIFFNFLLLPFLGTSVLILLLFQLMLKTLSDYFFLKKSSNYFQKTQLMRYFLPAQILHILYIVTIGFWSNIQKNYIWKDRKVR